MSPGRKCGVSLAGVLIERPHPDVHRRIEAP
jgi:hypothetical protein